MQESAKSVKSVNANFLHFTNSCLSSTRGKYLGCFIHKFTNSYLTTFLATGARLFRTIISHKIVSKFALRWHFCRRLVLIYAKNLHISFIFCTFARTIRFLI